jgi:hypothetical protein
LIASVALLDTSNQIKPLLCALAKLAAGIALGFKAIAKSQLLHPHYHH